MNNYTPSVLISLSDILLMLRSRIANYRRQNQHEADINYQLWNPAGYDASGLIRAITLAAFQGVSYPDNAIDILNGSGMDYEYCKEIVVELVDAIQGVIIDNFPQATIAQLAKFSHCVLDDGTLVVYPNGMPLPDKSTKGNNNVDSDFTND